MCCFVQIAEVDCCWSAGHRAAPVVNEDDVAQDGLWTRSTLDSPYRCLCGDNKPIVQKTLLNSIQVCKADEVNSQVVCRVPKWTFVVWGIAKD